VASFRQPFNRHYEYRIVWRYKGSVGKHSQIYQRPGYALRALHRLSKTHLHLGLPLSRLKRAWVRLAYRLGVPFEAVKTFKVRDVLTRVAATYGSLSELRIEHRQVGEWTELIDPIRNLRTGRTASYEAERLALLAKLDAMSQEELDKWRALPQ
jgi:hypothetical protein